MLGARGWVLGALGLGMLLLVPHLAEAQTNLQFWGNLTLDWMRSPRFTSEIEIEPKFLIAAPEDERSWRSLDLKVSGEFAARNWLDLIGELNTGYTHQTDDDDTTELTPGLGVRFHLLSRDLPRVLPIHERPPKRRIVLRNRVLVEYRNLFHTSAGTESTVRARNRLEFQVPINREKVSDDGARYLMCDWEWFMPVDDPSERFANRQRIRTGFGYRHDAHWRFEFLYAWTRSRDTTDEDFRTSDNMINVRVKRVF